VTYTVKEIFYTLQGEGVQAGRPAVFLRFSGCNLWTGREQDRATAVCTFCDTDFVGVGPDGGKFATAAALADAVAAINALHARGFVVAVETNGTQPAPAGLDWICVSPKANAPLVLTRGDELKLVFPQPTALPERFAALEFAHFLLQPMDGPQATENTRAALAYCLAHPQWRLSLQTHKTLGIR
jgi:organic radical activating enzyme